MGERLIIVGGDAAGMSAASQARRRRSKDDLEILAFERGNYTSYSACGIPYLIGGTVEDVGTLVTRSPEAFRDDFDIDVRMRHEVVAIDTQRGEVTVRDLETDRRFTEPYDHLVIATGATPRRPDLENSDAEGIFGVQTLDDGLALRAALGPEVRKAVVVGAGYIGIEMAEAFVQRGIEVTVVERRPQPMTTLDPDMGAIVAERMAAMDIEVRCGEDVIGFETKDGRVSGVTTDKETLDVDIVVLGLGAIPNVALARDSEVPIGPAGGIVVDRRMRTPVEGVWAAGDCAEKFHLISRRPVAIALGTHANKEGRTAGINIGGGYETFPGVVGTSVSKVCDVEVARTGLLETEVVEAGFRFLTATVDSTTRAGYFPGAAPIKTKMIVERNSGRLLGAQIVGEEGAAKRIDVIATALWNRMTVDEMLNMDLSYAPPFSPVWDPVLITARKAWQKVEESLAP